MASRTAVDRALLLLLALLLPFHLLSLLSRALRRRSSNRSPLGGSARLVLPLLILIPVSVSVIFALSDLEPSDGGRLALQLKELKLKVAQLESILEENTKILDSKKEHLDENNKQIEEMDHKIRFLQDAIYKMKESHGSTAHFDKTIKSVDEEVRLLWAESRKNSFNIHVLESKAYEEDGKFEALASEVEKMENIVTEQWIQIQQLEQALQTTKMMTSKVRKKSTTIHKEKPKECTIWKFIKCICRYSVPEVAKSDPFFFGGYISSSSISRSFNQLKRMMITARKWHHELQDSVRWVLEMNESTTALAHEEIVFFIASAIIIFPILSACHLFSSPYGRPE